MIRPWILCVCIAGCRGEPAAQIVVVTGPAPADTVSFAPTAAFSEYVELPGERNELRITLSSFDASCERYALPQGDQTLVTVLVLTPPGTAPKVGSYPYDAPLGADKPVDAAISLPKAQIGKRSHTFEPGGLVRLTQVDLGSHGSISGLLDFHFRGEADRPATRLEGSFRAKICRFNPAPEH